MDGNYFHGHERDFLKNCLKESLIWRTPHGWRRYPPAIQADKEKLMNLCLFSTIFKKNLQYIILELIKLKCFRSVSKAKANSSTIQQIQPMFFQWPMEPALANINLMSWEDKVSIIKNLKPPRVNLIHWGLNWLSIEKLLLHRFLPLRKIRR